MSKKISIIILFIVLAILIIIPYYGFQNNYFFSDDFEWISRGIISIANPMEILRIKGRDFNPLFIITTSSYIKLFGLSPVILRLSVFFVFLLVLFLLYEIMIKILNTDNYIALSLIFLFAINVYISEIILNYSALVYLLSFLFFLIATLFYNKERYGYFIFFLFCAFLFKEIILLGFISLFFIKKPKKSRIILLVSLMIVILIRVILQLNSTSTYTSFISYKYYFIKLYLIFFRALNINPYSIPPMFGFLIILLFMIFFICKSIKRTESSYLFPLSFFIIYLSFFSLLPKLSSRYIFLPSVGFFLLLSVLMGEFKKRFGGKIYIPIILIMILSFIYNFPLIKKEVMDYRILGKFSYKFIFNHSLKIKEQFGKSDKIFIGRENLMPLKNLYFSIYKNGGISKLLPIRRGSVGGVIHPEDLVPIVFYPDYIAKWKNIKTENNGFYGKIIVLKKE